MKCPPNTTNSADEQKKNMAATTMTSYTKNPRRSMKSGSDFSETSGTSTSEQQTRYGTRSHEFAGNTDTVHARRNSCYITEVTPRPITIRFPCGCFMTTCLGAFIAFAMSWVFNHSVAWAIFHTILNWLYVMYKAGWYVVTNF